MNNATTAKKDYTWDELLNLEIEQLEKLLNEITYEPSRSRIQVIINIKKIQKLKSINGSQEEINKLELELKKYPKEHDEYLKYEEEENKRIEKLKKAKQITIGDN